MASHFHHLLTILFFNVIMKVALIILMPFLILSTSCKELFYPKIDTDENMLVVDGLISNGSENYVKLYLTTSFNSTTGNIPIQKATVVISDNSGNNYNLEEKIPGNYTIDSIKLSPKIGETYTLNIKTSDGTEYESDPQKMQPVIPIDTVYGSLIDKEVLTEILKGDPFLEITKCTVAFIDIKNVDNTLKFRFINSLLLEEQSKHASTYLWQIKNIDDHINLTGSQTNLNTSDILNFEESTFSIEEKTYNLPDSVFVKWWVLIIKEFSINEATYNFYHKIDKQINSNGQLFDPLTSQIIGNIHCINDKNIKVFGFFEASPFIYLTYIVIPDKISNTVQYIKTKNTGLIPYSGGPTFIKPTFWRDIFN